MDNLFNDDITKSIASTVQDVLEGKPAVKKEEVKYPHMMYDPKTGEGVEVKDKAEHDKYSEMGWGHDKPKSVSEVEEPNVPSKDANMGSKEGEAEFKKMHKGKKVGDKEDGSNIKENADGTVTVSLVEKLKAGSGKTTVDVDHTGEGIKQAERKYKLKFKKTRHSQASMDISGKKSDVLAYLQSKDGHGYSDDEVEELYPELLESVAEDKLKESEKQKAYQKFFSAALKKFGVESPKDLDDTKKKEFFDYVDKNYKAKAEEIDARPAKSDEEDLEEALSKKDMEKRLILIKKAVEKINRQNLRNAKADAMKMMKDSGMFDESSDSEEDEEEVNEGTLKVDDYDDSDFPNIEKKMGLKLKSVGAGTHGGEKVELSGPDSKLVKFAHEYLGVESKNKNLKAVQKELDDM